MKTSPLSIFHWKGNTSHPQPGPWMELIDAFVRHLIQRYGIEEVRTWFFEVWNEPNLYHFWTGTQENYFKLYRYTVEALKDVDERLRARQVDADALVHGLKPPVTPAASSCFGRTPSTSIE